MRLISPGNVGRRDQEDGDTTVSRRVYQLMERPVLQHKTDEEHEDPECPKDRDRGYLSILSVAYPQPSQQEHR